MLLLFSLRSFAILKKSWLFPSRSSSVKTSFWALDILYIWRFTRKSVLSPCILIVY